MYDKMRLLVDRNVKQITDKYVSKTRAQIREVISWWRLEIRWRLAMPYRGGPNMTEWPRRRTGRLRDSVPRYTIEQRKTFKGAKLPQTQVAFTLARRNTGPEWDTYGAILNDWHDKTFGGWQDRAYGMLMGAIRDRVRGAQ